MKFGITITAEAGRQFDYLSAREQGIAKDSIRATLVHQPDVETKAVKRLRPNPFAQFELRIGDLRILYNFEGAEVVLLLVRRKVGNKLVVGGREFHEHQND